MACGDLNVFCPPNSATPTTVAIGHYSTPVDAPAEQKTGQLPCEIGFTCVRGEREKCPVDRVCDKISTAKVSDGNGALVTAEDDMSMTGNDRASDLRRNIQRILGRGSAPARPWSK